MAQFGRHGRKACLESSRFVAQFLGTGIVNTFHNRGLAGLAFALAMLSAPAPRRLALAALRRTIFGCLGSGRGLSGDLCGSGRAVLGRSMRRGRLVARSARDTGSSEGRYLSLKLRLVS